MHLLLVSLPSLLQRLHAVLPQAVSGGSDPIHVTLRHSLPPHTNLLLIAARAYNATNCRIDRMQIQVLKSHNPMGVPGCHSSTRCDSRWHVSPPHVMVPHLSDLPCPIYVCVYVVGGGGRSCCSARGGAAPRGRLQRQPRARGVLRGPLPPRRAALRGRAGAQRERRSITRRGVDGPTA